MKNFLNKLFNISKLDDLKIETIPEIKKVNPRYDLQLMSETGLILKKLENVFVEHYSDNIYHIKNEKNEIVMKIDKGMNITLILTKI